jgi:hypothetical protein
LTAAFIAQVHRVRRCTAGFVTLIEGAKYMPRFWTKNGKPLFWRGNDVFLPSGTLIGHIVGDRVFGPEDGGYVGTLVDDRLVYRSFDKDGPLRAYPRRLAGSDDDIVPPSRTWGDEPALPE